jgi:hypothetical protein
MNLCRNKWISFDLYNGGFNHQKNYLCIRHECSIYIYTQSYSIYQAQHPDNCDVYGDTRWYIMQYLYLIHLK